MRGVGLRGIRVWEGAMTGRPGAARTAATALDGRGSEGVEAFGRVGRE